MKELGAAIQKLLKKHNEDDEMKGDILDDQKAVKVARFKEKKTPKFKPKNVSIEEITGALVKAANSKNRMKNSTEESADKSLKSEESADKLLKNESNIAENWSLDDGKSHEKGDKILEDLGLKKKKGLPLASAVARGDKPPCICPDKGRILFSRLLFTDWLIHAIHSFISLVR